MGKNQRNQKLWWWQKRSLRFYMGFKTSNDYVTVRNKNITLEEVCGLGNSRTKPESKLLFIERKLRVVMCSKFAGF